MNEDATLKMSMASETPLTLPEHEQTMYTGYMSDCVSTIVLFGLSGSKYKGVRGFHALGEIGNTNWERLFEGVPNDATTQIHIFPGEYNGYEHRLEQIREVVTENALKCRLTKAQIIAHPICMHASVSRFGQVEFTDRAGQAHRV